MHKDAQDDNDKAAVRKMKGDYKMAGSIGIEIERVVRRMRMVTDDWGRK